ncbi:hypothetical protein ACF0H5_018033 [Mactra antiquata]
MMNSRDTKNAKGFPKRLLSSFRKGKKTHSVDKVQNEATEASNLLKDENIQNDDCVNLEATVLLDSPKKDANTKLGDPSISFTPKRSLRHVLSANDAVLGGISSTSSTPRVPRFELGGTMSASTDSGIDCSILLSEKSSPELFVAFTRREAERLRQEQALNGSMLETLTEVDKSSSDSDSEKMNTEVDSVNINGCNSIKKKSQVCDKTIIEEKNALQSADMNASVCIVNNVQDTKYSSDDSGKSVAKQHKKEEGDYVLLHGENNSISSSQLVDLTEVIKHNKEENETRVDAKYKEISDRTEICEDGHEDTVLNRGNSSTVEDYYLSYYANRTDESKAEEMNATDSHVPHETVLFNSSHSIVNPVPMSSTSSRTTHETLPSSISPSKIFVNENSAFAKCKSLQRSVSEASKGFLHKIRSRHKDISINNGNKSIVGEKSFNVKKSGLSVLKKFGVKKKGNSKKCNHGDQVIKLFNHLDPGNLVMEDDETTEITKKIKSRSPVLKEIVDIDNTEISLIEDEKINDLSLVTNSPVFKEVLSESVRNELEASIQRRCSPVGQEATIVELTDNINRMTSALCSSSADSIACICDCKNKSSETDCCDRKKSTSPVLDKTVEKQNECDQTKQARLLRTPSPQIFTGCVEISCTPDVICEDNNKSLLLSDTLLLDQSIYNINDENARISHTEVNTSKQLSQNNGMHDECLLDDLSQSEESCDEYSCDCDDSECSCEEWTDLDCSNCCNVSPNTGNVDLLSSSSDSEYDGEGSIVHHLSHKNNTKEVSSSRSADFSSNFSTTLNSESCTPEKSKSEFTETSPYSVSFNEVVCDNGDVMYVENSFSDYQDLCWKDNKKQSPCHFNSPSSPYMRGSSTFNVPSGHKSLLQQTLQSNHQRSNQKSNKKSSYRDQHHDAYSPTLYQDTNPTSHDINSSFTNVSFEGSFADASFTVKNPQEESYREYLNTSSHEISFSDRTSVKMSKSKKRSSERLSASLNVSYLDSMNSRSGVRQCLNESYVDGLSQNRTFSHLNDSRFSYGQLNPVNSLNDSLALNMCKRVPDKYKVDHNSSVSFYREPASDRKVDPRLNRSLSSVSRDNKSFNRYAKLNRSFHGTSSASSPLDLSMTRPKSPKPVKRSKPDKLWVERHVGQVYSPAKRVLHKNQGLSENDLCKQILDLYVSDADESGFEVNMDETLNRSSVLNSSTDSSRKSESCPGANYDCDRSSESEGEPSCLQYGTYVAPRNVVKETNVDDFTTTTVWTCYSGEARTRRLQDAGNTSISNERKSRLIVDKSNNSLTRRKKQKSKIDNSTNKIDKARNKMDNSRNKGDNSMNEESYMEDELNERQALSDRTNTVPRSCKQEIQCKLNDSISSLDTEEDEEDEELNEKKVDPRRLVR